MNISKFLNVFVIVLIVKYSCISVANAYKENELTVELVIIIEGLPTPVPSFQIEELSDQGKTIVKPYKNFTTTELETGKEYQLQIKKIDINGNEEIVTNSPHVRFKISAPRSLGIEGGIKAAVIDQSGNILVSNQLPQENFYRSYLDGEIRSITRGSIYAEYMNSETGGLGFSMIRISIVATLEYIKRLREYHMQKEGLTEEPGDWIPLELLD